MEEANERKLPRDFYPAIVSIEKAARVFNIPQEAIDDMLDEVEEDILDGLEQTEEQEEDPESGD